MEREDQDLPRLPSADRAAVRRWLSISLPWWPTDLVRRRRSKRHAGRGGDPSAAERGDAPILLHREHRGAREVAGLCPRAAAAGARRGMPLAEAKAICGEDTLVQAWTPEADGRSLRRLAHWCTRYAPLVMPVDHEASPHIVIDVSGCELVHGGDATLAIRVVRDFHRRGLQARVAVGPTQRAAVAASIGLAASPEGRAAPCLVLHHDPRRAAESLAPLPLRALGLCEETLEALREVNVRRIGEALRLPRRESADRFGPELLAVLDSLRGEVAEPFHPLPHARPIAVEVPFEGPTTRLESVLHAASQALERFCVRLARRGRGVRLLEWSLHRVNALPAVERVALGRPSRHARHLWMLLRPRLERVQMGFGVEGVSLRSLIDAPLAQEQRRWSGTGRADGADEVRGASEAPRDDPAARHGDPETERQLSEMLDQVASRLGGASVHHAAAALPEERRDGARRAAAPRSALRPTMIFPRALAAEVVAEEAPGARRPIEVRWPGGGGRVVECEGPERHSPSWWDAAPGGAGSGAARNASPNASDRDFWRVRTIDGRSLWLLHRPPDRWLVVGAWA